MAIPTQIKEASEAIDRLYNPEEADEVVEEQPEVAEEGNQSPQEPKGEDWEYRFKTYKSNTDNTIHELRTNNSQLQATNQSLQDRLDELEQRIANPETPESYESFSSDEIKELKTIVRKEFEAEINQLKQENSYLKQRQESSDEAQAQASHQKKIDYLKNEISKEVPNFAEIDLDPKFKDWLNTPDQYGILRFESLTTARDRGDVASLIGLYKAYESTISVPPKANKQQPSSARSSAPTMKSGSNIQWTGDAINQFYRDKVDGKFTAEEADRLEKEMFAVAMGGR